ncbi:ribosome recycling factor [Daejeonella sp. H1SJ63]|jgi:ribosome recycling factor|uniref:ribosome recycling factor n=1 Tax=Daejeonella sp. H1SJ63 TaxID=3034145 RepID=UPI0023ECC5AB|nr:ribosome recycling factor [Daejeonella sp. H1SJ63]
MNDLIKKQLDDAKAHMEKAIEFCDGELVKIRAGKAMPSMLDGIYVDYYGTATPLNQIGTVNTPDARTLVVQPWEKSMISAIERAIMEANIGLNPQNDGLVIRLNVPPLTEERRKDLVKKVKEEAEKGRIAVRNIRKDANEKIKRTKSEGVSDDEIKGGENEVQKLTDSCISRIDRLMEAKEKDIMTV